MRCERRVSVAVEVTHQMGDAGIVEDRRFEKPVNPTISSRAAAGAVPGIQQAALEIAGSKVTETLMQR